MTAILEMLADGTVFSPALYYRIKREVIAGGTRKKPAAKKEKKTKAKTEKPKAAPVSDDIQNPGLFAVLCEWRTDRARRENVPAYVVASTRALIAVANAVPTSPAQLKALPGWGPKSVARFGEELLDVIASADF